MHRIIRLKELYPERPKRPKQSDRVKPGDPVRLSRTYRLHRDRLIELDELAKYKGISKAATIERLIRFATCLRRDLEDEDSILIKRTDNGGWKIRPTEPNHTTDNNQQQPGT